MRGDGSATKTCILSEMRGTERESLAKRERARARRPHLGLASHEKLYQVQYQVNLRHI